MSAILMRIILFLLNKIIYLMLCVFSLTTFAQNINVKIVDSETSEVIPDARIILDQQIYYSNDEGIVSIPENSTHFDISVSGFKSLKNVGYQSVIKLSPLYKDIDEVKIVSIDVKKIFKEVYDHYSKKYYSKPAMYDITFWQKSFENNQMKQLMVADGKFWNRDGNYNAKEALNKKFNNFVQLQIDDLRYLRTEPNEFNLKVKKQNISQDYVGDLFFSYELFRINRFINMRKSVTSAKLLYENEDEQEISYRIKTDENLIYSGKIIYDKKDQVITHLEMDFSQSGFPAYHRKDENQVPYKYQLGDGTLTFDFYKIGKSYVPSKISVKGGGFKYITDTKTFEYRSERSIVFKNFKEANKTGLANPVEINGQFWKNLKVSDDKGQVNVTSEEQNFINENTNEN